MNKKGFTLVELLVVIAIIAVLSIIIVPSVINVNRNVNNRLYNDKVENIESSAQLYATNNDELFNTTDEVTVSVAELIEAGYVTVDTKVGSGACDTSSANNATKGCVVDPRSQISMNSCYVIIRKQRAGYTATFVCDVDGDGNEINTTSERLVDKVCDGIKDGGNLIAQSSANGERCYCNSAHTALVYENNTPLQEGEACIIAGDDPANWLRYGDSTPNWRVLGLYSLRIDGELKIAAKMITNLPI